ncbi:MAG: hypothetical protein B6I32_05010 [Desulfobacterium sp. 4572_20]|nr:MAG: hypothetical protein B6I32_05010 [Desulfobacterium sp. 4572_20]
MDTEKKKEEKKKKGKDLDRMTVKELKEVAAETTDLVGVHAMKKSELLAAIKDAKGIKEKAKRKEARKSRDKRMVHILRRKINRLKKETRRISKA